MQSKLDEILNKLERLEKESLALKKDKDNELIDINEFCRLTGWSKNTAYRYIHEKPDIKVYRFGRFLRFKREEVINWLNDQIK